MSQSVITLNLKDLVLWTENPRDAIDDTATDQDIVDRAILDKRSKWSLPKLAKDMGNHYDFSELPTVVFHEDKPVVYDGNRRVILGKIKHKLVFVDGFDINSIPEIPIEIPCNVCSKDIALQNVYRKHSDTGSWLPLERDIFLNKFMNKPKSTFLIMEENTGIISANSYLNQRFVKDEIFREDILAKLGIRFVDEKITSQHSKLETKQILENLSNKIKVKEISTRKNRGDVIKVLDPSFQRVVDEHKDNKYTQLSSENKNSDLQKFDKQKPKQSRRVQSKSVEFFGGKLYLQSGDVCNLYRDIVDLYVFYCDKKKSLSEAFPNLIRMALRLLCETAANDCNLKMDKYINSHFQKAKNSLAQDTKTSLANSNVTENSIIQLLQTGAHSYTTSTNFEQTLAISIILGAILTISHGKEFVA